MYDMTLVVAVLAGVRGIIGSEDLRFDPLFNLGLPITVLVVTLGGIACGIWASLGKLAQEYQNWGVALLHFVLLSPLLLHTFPEEWYRKRRL